MIHDKTIRKFGTTLHLDFLANTVQYELKAGRRTIFSGKDFRPSPLYSWDSPESYGSLMSFLTLQPGDTDAEYFDNYTPEQFEFASSDAAEQWRLWIYDRNI